MDKTKEPVKDGLFSSDYPVTFQSKSKLCFHKKLAPPLVTYFNKEHILSLIFWIVKMLKKILKMNNVQFLLGTRNTYC